MPNPENVTKNKITTTSEARKRGKAGGLKSAEARSKKKLLKEELEALLDSGKTQEKVCLALLDKALSGDIRAFEVIRDSIGQKPKEEVINTNLNTDATIEELKSYFEQ